MLKSAADQQPPEFAELEFWAWSLDRYGREGVDSLALRLQDDFDLNVNILLWACWIAERFDVAPELVFRKAIDVAAQWSDHVTAPLRSARRFLKTRNETEGAQTLRTQIKAAELAAEKIEQKMLESLAASKLTPAPARNVSEACRRARRNLATYASLAKVAHKKDFSTLLLQSFLDRIFSGDAPEDPGEGSQQ